MTKTLYQVVITTDGAAGATFAFADTADGPKYGAAAYESLMSHRDIRGKQPSDESGTETFIPYDHVVNAIITKTVTEAEAPEDAFCTEG